MVVANDAIKPLPVATGKASMPAHATERLVAAGAVIVPAGKLASDAGTAKASNVVLLGALSDALEFSADTWEEVIARRVPPKTVEANLVAFRKGSNFMKNGR